MDETFSLTMTGFMMGFDIENPEVDPETGDLLRGRPVHTVAFEEPDGVWRTMRVRLTADRRFADLPVGKPARVTVEVPHV